MLDHRVLQSLLDAHREAVCQPVRTFDIGGRSFDFNRYRYLVGVINLSTDSWYRESVCGTTEEAIARAERLSQDGADIIDVGAESTLPEARQADVAQQLDRLLPVVEALKARRLLISVESYYPEVLEACARAGADIFNITGTRFGDDIFRLAADYDAAVILCYVQGDTVRDVSDFRFHDDMTAEVADYFRALTAHAAGLGVSKCFHRSGAGFLLPQFAGQPPAHQLPAQHLPELLPPAHLGLPDVQHPAARPRNFPGGRTPMPPSRFSACWPCWAAPTSFARTKSARCTAFVRSWRCISLPESHSVCPATTSDYANPTYCSDLCRQTRVPE